MIAICKEDKFINGITLCKGYEYSVTKERGKYRVTNHYGHNTLVGEMFFKRFFEVKNESLNE